MLRNYFLIGVRNLLKNKVFSFINISGLAVGISCCVLLGLYIQDEFSYEKHFEDVENIYRITSSMTQEGSTESSLLQRTSPPVAMTMLREFPELESATRVVNPPEVEQHLVQLENNVFYEKVGYLVDSTFFKVFSFDFREGNIDKAFADRSTVVLSDQLAKKLFGNESALNQTLIITSGWSVDTFKVTGVLKPLKGKSHVDAGFYMSMNSEGWGDMINSMTTWSGNNFMFSYIRLKPGTSKENLLAKFPALQEKYGAEEMKAMKRHKSLGLQPLKDVHLHSGHFDFNLDLGTNGSITYIYVLGSVAGFILLIACINFINLTTAKATQRAGEVGVRKTMGASKAELIKQFLGESLLIVGVAMLLSLGLIQLSLPLFNNFAQRSMEFTAQTWEYVLLFLLGIGIFTGLLGGSYPAFILSSFQPATVLKGKSFNVGSSQWTRKTLVVIQFIIAIVLLSSTFVIQKQLGFIQSKDLGFDSDFRVMLPLRTPEAKNAYQNLKTELLQISGVNEVSASTSLPSTPLLRDFMVYAKGDDMKTAEHHFISFIDEGYFKLLNIPIVAGRELRKESDQFDPKNERQRVMVNRTSLRKLNIAEEDAIGSTFYWSGKVVEVNEERTYEYEIVGVVDDFHYASLHNGIDPIAFFLPAEPDSYLFLGVSVQPEAYPQIRSKLETIWKKYVPTTPFESQLLSDSVAKSYQRDRLFFGIITVFTIIAIIISCLGLYGLSVYVSERRVKEIGIRKVLGATTTSIVKMLSWEFIGLVAIAMVVAIPLSYYAMEKWLENFAYKIDLTLIIFFVASAVSFLVAWLTIGFESVRAATSNPVDSLRND